MNWLDTNVGSINREGTGIASGSNVKIKDRRAKTKVVILHSSDDLYGADRILLQIASGMQAAGLEPVVVLPDDTSSRGLLFGELNRRGISVSHLPIAVMRRRYLRPLGLVALTIRLIRGTLAVRTIVKAHSGPTLIYGFTFAVIAAPIAATLLRIPLLSHCHEILEKPRLLRKVMHGINVRAAKRVLCVSHAVRQNILSDEASRSDRIQVVYNGLAADLTAARDRQWARGELGISDETPIIGMVGRVCTWKGQDLFLKAAAILKQRGRIFHAIAIGGVFDSDQIHMDHLLELRRELHMEGCFQVVDFRKDARALMAAFDILVCPSTRPDPFPTVILEAMDNSIPVIASAHGGPTEMVLDGVTGLLFEPNNADSLAQIMDILLLDPDQRGKMGTAGKQRLLKTFCVETQLTAINRAALEVAVGEVTTS